MTNYYNASVCEIAGNSTIFSTGNTAIYIIDDITDNNASVYDIAQVTVLSIVLVVLLSSGHDITGNSTIFSTVLQH